MPASFRPVSSKPSAIVKEPSYMGKAQHGAFRIGNGPRNITYFAVDEAPDKIVTLYVDVKQNGNLSDDGPGDWEKLRVLDGINNYMTVVPVRVSWGTAIQENEHGA